MTVELLRLNAVVGVQGKVNDMGQLTSLGITCAFCHSTVDNSFAPGIGKRLDGWANLDLNVVRSWLCGPSCPMPSGSSSLHGRAERPLSEGAVPARSGRGRYGFGVCR